MNTSRRTALKVAGTSAMLVAGGTAQGAQAATRSGGRRSANPRNTTLPVGTRLLIRARAQDPATGLLLTPEASLVVSGGEAVAAGGSGPSVLVPPADALSLQALRRDELNGAAGAGGESVLELRVAIPAGHRLEVRLRYAVASGVSASRLKGVHCSASLDMVAAGLSRGFHEVQSPGVVAALA